MQRPRMRSAGRRPAAPDRARPNWVVASLLAGIAMAGFVMLVAATLLHKGFLTPLYMIAAPLTGPDEATVSLSQARAGDPLWYAPGSLTLGALVHLTWSLMFGAVFSWAVTRLQVAGPGVVAAAVLYGLAVMLVMSFVTLPLVAGVLGGGTVVSDMPARVGWATWIIAHIVFGFVLGTLSVPRPRRGRPLDHDTVIA